MDAPLNTRVSPIFRRRLDSIRPLGVAGPALAVALIVLLVVMGCATTNPHAVSRPDPRNAHTPGTILEGGSGRSMDYEQLIDRLARVQVVYVGEQHTNAHHHEVQLRIVRSLLEKKGRISIGMEMFDLTYQPKLERWRRGDLQWPEFLKQVHWYANWKYPAELYQPILMAVQENRLPLIGLNLPFHIPPKIAQGGIDSLSAEERALLPESIDTTHAAHRAYVEEIFKQHRFPGQGDFASFYEAQCVWEETMAQSIADRLDNGTMVVIAGNGHIFRHFGIPDRAFKRTKAPFRTVYLVTPQTEFSLQDGDYIFVTDAGMSPHP